MKKLSAIFIGLVVEHVHLASAAAIPNVDVRASDELSMPDLFPLQSPRDTPESIERQTNIFAEVTDGLPFLLLPPSQSSWPRFSSTSRSVSTELVTTTATQTIRTSFLRAPSKSRFIVTSIVTAGQAYCGIHGEMCRRIADVGNVAFNAPDVHGYITPRGPTATRVKEVATTRLCKTPPAPVMTNHEGTNFCGINGQICVVANHKPTPKPLHPLKCHHEPKPTAKPEHTPGPKPKAHQHAKPHHKKTHPKKPHPKKPQAPLKNPKPTMQKHATHEAQPTAEAFNPGLLHQYGGAKDPKPSPSTTTHYDHPVAPVMTDKKSMGICGFEGEPCKLGDGPAPTPAPTPAPRRKEKGKGEAPRRKEKGKGEAPRGKEKGKGEGKVKRHAAIVTPEAGPMYPFPRRRGGWGILDRFLRG